MTDSPQPDNSEFASRRQPEFNADANSKQIVRQLRRNWVRKVVRRTFWFVGLPTALAAIYYGLWASDQFESTALIALQGAEPVNAMRPELLPGAPSNSTNNNRELLAIREFILSRSMFELADQRVGCVRHYQDRKWDFFARLSNRTSREQAFSYYLSKVAAEFDSASGTVSLRVRAFKPNAAKALADSILLMCDSMLEESSKRMNLELLKSAESQVAEAKERLLLAKRRIASDNRERAPLVNESAGTGPKPKPASRTSSVNPRPDSAPDISNDAAERTRLELAFAEKAYESSIATLAEVRIYDMHHRKQLVKISAPFLPDYSTYPRRLASVITVLIFSFLIMGIGTLTVTAIREHTRI